MSYECISVFAMALFYRFQDSATFSFMNREDWFMWKALYVKGSPNKEISGATQQLLYKDLEQYLKGKSSRKADLCRTIGTMFANSIDHSAQDPLLMEAQDFDPKIQCSFPRNDILPPEKLQRKVFPFIERARKELEAVEAERGVNETSAHSFLNLFAELCRIFLQDLVCYRRNKISTYLAEGCPQITNDEMFLKFEQQLNEHLTITETMPETPATENQISAEGLRDLINAVNQTDRFANIEALNNQRFLKGQEAQKKMEERLVEKLGERLEERLEEMMAVWMHNERKLEKKRRERFEKRMIKFRKTVQGRNITQNDLRTGDNVADESDSVRGSEGTSMPSVTFPQFRRSSKKRKLTSRGTKSKLADGSVFEHQKNINTVTDLVVGTLLH